jgi:hypothetical protein
MSEKLSQPLADLSSYDRFKHIARRLVAVPKEELATEMAKEKAFNEHKKNGKIRDRPKFKTIV